MEGGGGGQTLQQRTEPTKKNNHLRGSLFLFDSSAVKAVLDTIHIDNKMAGGVSVFLHNTLNMTGGLISVVDIDTRVEGYTIDHWSNYAKKKSFLASRICKQNGELKTQLASCSNTCPNRE